MTKDRKMSRKMSSENSKNNENNKNNKNNENNKNSPTLKAIIYKRASIEVSPEGKVF